MDRDDTIIENGKYGNGSILRQSRMANTHYSFEYSITLTLLYPFYMQVFCYYTQYSWNVEKHKNLRTEMFLILEATPNSRPLFLYTPYTYQLSIWPWLALIDFVVSSNISAL